MSAFGFTFLYASISFSISGDTEEDPPTTHFPDGIAVIVNKANTADELSADQVKSIYVGDVTTWDEVSK